MHQVRPAAVAGAFYPGEALSLSRTVKGLLEACSPAAPAAVRNANRTMIGVMMPPGGLQLDRTHPADEHVGHHE